MISAALRKGAWLVLVLSASLRAGAQGPPLAPQVLAPGDAVRIAVWRNPEMSAELVTVGLDGTLTHPLYQGIPVAGVPADSVRARIRRFLTTFSDNPQFSLEPLYRVAVAGEVRQPGLLSLPGHTTLLQAVAIAGGATERGRLDQVTLVRAGQSFTIDFTSASSREAALPIHSGDQIVVPRKRDLFREYIAPGAGVVAAIAAIVNIFR